MSRRLALVAGAAALGAVVWLAWPEIQFAVIGVWGWLADLPGRVAHALGL